MNTSFDKDKVGTYNVEYTVKDLDGNESSYIITIEVKEKNQSNDSSNDDNHKNNGNDDKPDDYDTDKERVNRIIIVVSSIIGCIFIALVILFEFFRIRKKNKNKHQNKLGLFFLYSFTNSIVSSKSCSFLCLQNLFKLSSVGKPWKKCG